MVHKAHPFLKISLVIYQRSHRMLVGFGLSLTNLHLHHRTFIEIMFGN